MNATQLQHDVPAAHTQRNGSAMAAVFAAGIGAFAMGVVVIASELGASVPALYAPAGGVSGRTSLAALVWLASWIFLHNRWKNRYIETRRVHTWTMLLAGAGILLTFPPVWKMLPG